MNKKDKIIRALKKRILYLIVIIVGVVLIFIGAWQNDGDLLEVAFGLLSGAIVALLSSSLLSKANQEPLKDASRTISLLNAIKKDMQDPCDDVKDIELFKGTGNNAFSIEELLAAAKRRIWILGTNLSNTMLHYKKTIRQRILEQDGLDVKIIANHPESLFHLLRYHEIPGKTLHTMRRGILDANEDLLQLQKEILAQKPDANFTLKTSLVQPTVLLMIIDDRIVISHILMYASTSNNARVMFEPYNPNSAFVKHFTETWNRGEPLTSCPDCCSDKMLSKNGNTVVEYSITKKYSPLREFFLGIGNGIATFFRFIGKYFATLAAPLCFLIAAIIGLICLQTVNPEEFLLYNNIRAAALGILSGSMLSTAEYLFDHYSEQKESVETDAEEELQRERLQSAIDGNFFCQDQNYGVELFKDRNSANIRDLILSAKKRVWIYATNHKYINDQEGVESYLKENTHLDVRFLMLDPHSLFLSTRHADIPKSSAEAFAEEIGSNMESLLAEYKGYRHIKLKSYLRQPTFMLYLIDDVLIVSPILIQGRAREQEHFCFNLVYPSVEKIARDYLQHFQGVWQESKKISAKSARYVKRKRSKFITVEKGQKIQLICSSYQPAEKTESIPT